MLRGKNPARRPALCGMMIALAFVFSYVESLLPLSLGIPGVKLGLANLVSMTALYLLGFSTAALVSLIRIILAGFTFSSLSMSLYSLGGGVLCLGVRWILKKSGRFGILGASAAGGAAHNMGQLAVACVVLENLELRRLAPLLFMAGMVSGTLIGLLGGLVSIRVKKYLQ